MTIDLSKHFRGQVAQKAILYRGGKVLVVRNHGEEVWDLPGGHLDKGEHPEASIAREILEETGLASLELKPFCPDTFVTVRASGDSYFLLVYTAEVPASAEIVKEDDELAEVRWVGKEDVGSMPLFKEYKAALEKFFTLQ